MLHIEKEYELTHSRWTPTSWKNFPISQTVEYKNNSDLKYVCQVLNSKNELILMNEILILKEAFKKAAKNNELFFLQMGDCAERFQDSSDETTEQKYNFLIYFAKFLEDSLQKTVLPIGRIAGQYAKPRTENYEFKGQIKYPTFRGDLIHSYELTEKSREFNALRFLDGYECSYKILKKIKSFNHSLFTSHEALELNYESSLTRWCPKEYCYFNSSAHFVWLGERTKNLNGAHVEFLRGIANPIGIKIGPHFQVKEIVELIHTLNPEKEIGKIILITRLGIDFSKYQLQKLIENIQQSKLNVLWFVDPMHGNTIKIPENYKTRFLDDICTELFNTIQVHRNLGTFLSGIHLESTHENIIECYQNQKNLNDFFNPSHYTSHCDPRLNHSQTKTTLEFIAQYL